MQGGYPGQPMQQGGQPMMQQQGMGGQPMMQQGMMQPGMQQGGGPGPMQHAGPGPQQAQQVQQTQQAAAGAVREVEAKIATTISEAEAKSDAEKCRNAMKGMGTNEKAIIDTVGIRTSADMQLIKKQFAALFQRDLVKDFTDECSGKFRDVLLAICKEPADLDATLVRQAVKGLGTDEELLSEIICTRSPHELKAASDSYQRQFSRNMEGDIKGDTSGDLAKVYMACMSSNRGTRAGNVAADVEALYKAGAGKIGTDEATFINIIASSTRAHVEAIFWAYAQKYGKSLDTVIRNEMGGDTGKALANLALPHHVLFAEKILKSMKGMGTNDTDLIRLITTQRGRHLKAAGKYFLEVNRKTISAWIGDETSGDYKNILVKICQTEGV
jgi:hypothetical protein